MTRRHHVRTNVRHPRPPRLGCRRRSNDGHAVIQKESGNQNERLRSKRRRRRALDSAYAPSLRSATATNAPSWKTWMRASSRGWCIVTHASRTPALEANIHMAMPNTLAGWTVPDLYRLPDDGNTYELVRGELFVTPAPSAPHQEVVSALTEVLFPYVAKHRIGRLHFPHSVVRV